MNYIVLLRGVNVGGKRKVSMSNLKSQLSEVGFDKVTSYINSGNILMTSKFEHGKTVDRIEAVFKQHYDFDVSFVALTYNEFQEEYENLPAWWFNEHAYRRNVLFYLPGFDIKEFLFAEDAFEKIYQGKAAIYWTIMDAERYSRSQYQKLAKSPIYSLVTIRNANTLKKLYELTQND